MAKPLELLEAMRKVSDNWDGYGGAAPRPELIDAAIAFFRGLRGAHGLSPPYVTPTRTGGVLFAWEQGPHQLEVEFRARLAKTRVEPGEFEAFQEFLDAVQGAYRVSLKLQPTTDLSDAPPDGTHLSELHAGITRVDRALLRLLGAAGFTSAGPAGAAYLSELLADAYAPRPVRE